MLERKEALPFGIHCPPMRKKRTKVYVNTVLVRFPLYCLKCKKEIPIGSMSLR